jgi:hypothetical protein
MGFRINQEARQPVSGLHHASPLTSEFSLDGKSGHFCWKRFAGSRDAEGKLFVLLSYYHVVAARFCLGRLYIIPKMPAGLWDFLGFQIIY